MEIPGFVLICATEIHTGQKKSADCPELPDLESSETCYCAGAGQNSRGLYPVFFTQRTPSSLCIHSHFTFTGVFLLKSVAGKEKFFKKKSIDSKSFILLMGNWGSHTCWGSFKAIRIVKMDRVMPL